MKNQEKQKKLLGSRKQAIEQYCKSCIYDKTEPGSWRQQVEACNSTDCPLYNFRAKSSVSIKEESNE